jgi:hypothetical protein
MSTPAAINLFGRETHEWTKEARKLLEELNWQHSFVEAGTVPGGGRPGNPYGLDTIPTLKIELRDVKLEFSGIEKIRNFVKVVTEFGGFKVEMSPNR